MDHSHSEEPITQTWRQVVSCSNASPEHAGEFIHESCAVAVEVPFILDIHRQGHYTFYCTPQDHRELAVGFMRTSGIIQSTHDIAGISEISSPTPLIEIHLTPECMDRISDHVPQSLAPRIDQDPAEILSPVGDLFRMSADRFQRIAKNLEQKQRIFPCTGGTHAAGVFHPDGHIEAFAEDITRHSALDKAIGHLLLKGCDSTARGVMLSGRVNGEMVMKCAHARLELIAAVSAPTSLALDMAQRCNITLCGFVRGPRATVFTHPHRIAGMRVTE